MYNVWNAHGLVLLCHKEKNEASGILGAKEFASGGRDALETALSYGNSVFPGEVMNPIRLLLLCPCR